MNTVKHAELVTLDQYTDLKLLCGLVENDLAEVRSKRIQKIAGSLIRLYVQAQNRSLTYEKRTLGIRLLEEKTLQNMFFLESKLAIWSMGILILDPAISPELIHKTVQSIKILGLLVATKSQRAALSGKTTFGLSAPAACDPDPCRMIRKNRDEFLRQFPGRFF